MQPITFKIAVLSGVPGELEGLGAKLPQNDRVAILTTLLNVLGVANDRWLQSHPNTPKLYRAGIVYAMEDSTEDWLDIPNIIKAGVGDCEDLASWRAAELRAEGIPAHAFVKWQTTPSGSTLYHILVARSSVDKDLPPNPDNERFLKRDTSNPGWWIEDPSAVLGM